MDRRTFFAKAAAFVAGTALALGAERHVQFLKLRPAWRRLNALNIETCWSLKPGMFVRWTDHPHRFFRISKVPEFTFEHQGYIVENFKCDKFYAHAFPPMLCTKANSDGEVLICLPTRFRSEEIEVYG